MKTEEIQAITPLFLGIIGLILGLAVILSPNLSDAKWMGGIGLATAAIAGASGASQSKGSTQPTQNIVADSVQKVESPSVGVEPTKE